MFVQGIVKIVLKNEVHIQIERVSSQLILSSGRRCDIRQGECLDSENRQIFNDTPGWLPIRSI